MKILLLVAFCLAIASAATPAHAQTGRLRNYAIDLEHHAERLAGYAEEIKRSGSRTSDFTIAKFNESVAAFDETLRKANAFIPTMRGDQQEIDDLLKRMNDALKMRTTAIEEANAALQAANEAMEKAGGLEQVRADIDRLDALGYEYSRFREELTTQPKEALRLLQQFQQVVAEYGRMEQQYAEFLQADNADTATLKGKMAQVKQRLEAVVPAAREKLADVYTIAEAEVEEMEAAIAEGEERRSPQFFLKDGPVVRETEEATLHLQLLSAIHPGTAEPLIERFEAGQKKSAQLKSELKQEIIAANRAYGDGYRGEERDAMVAGARRLFEREYPGDAIVDIRVPDVGWNRSTRWYYSVDEWRLIDQSSHMAVVVYEAKAEDGSPEYHMLPIDITKDHTKGDELRFSPWVRKPVEEMELRLRLLPENFEG